MVQPLIEYGEKLHIVTRRRYETDMSNHFVGILRASVNSIIRVHGYAFVFDDEKKEYFRHPELRTRIFGLDKADFIVNLIHPETELDEVVYEVKDDRLFATDNRRFSLDITEYSLRG